LFVCPQTFIVKYLIIIFKQNGHINTQTERRGKGLADGETERVCARGRQWTQIELASVVKMVVGRRINYFGFSLVTILMGEGDLQRYIKITKIE
jgi:hypothetical protein